MATPSGSAAPAVPAWQWPVRWTVALGLLMLLAVALPAGRLFASPADYAGTHTALEVLSVAVAGMVFALVWNLRHQASAPRWLLLGMALGMAALVDLAHLLAYAGMPDLVTPNGPEKAINFWLAARALALLGMLAAAWLPDAACAALMRSPLRALALSLGLVAGVWWLGLYRPQAWPATFSADSGLTGFKVAAEWLLATGFALAAGRFFWQGRATGDAVLCWLGAAASIQGLAELFFTLYSDVTDTHNLLGHVYKALAYGMVYRALFVAGVQAPYHRLAQERARHQALMAAMPAPVWLKDEAGRYLDCNPAFERMIGLPAQQIIGHRDADLVPVAEADSYRAHDQQTLDAAGPLWRERWMRFRGDNSLARLSIVKVPVHDANGRAIGVLGLGHDVTEQRQLQRDQAQRLREREGLYAVMALTADLEADWAAQMQAVANRLPEIWPQAATVAARLQLADQVWQSPDGLPADEPAVRCAVPVQAGAQVLGELALAWRQPAEPDSPWGFDDSQLAPVLAAVAGRIASCWSQRHTQQALRRREAVFSAIIGQAADGIVLFDALSGAVVEFNDAAARALGHDRSSFAGLNLSDLFVSLDQGVRGAAWASLKNQASVTMELALRRRDGSQFEVLMRARLLQLDRQPYLATISTDISGRKAVELRLRESELHFRNLANGSSALIWTSDPEQGCVFVNEPWLRFTGRSLAQELGRGWLDSLHPEDRQRCEAVFALADVRRTPFSLSYRMRRHDGQYRWLRDDGTPRLDSQGRFLGFVGFCVDITEQRQAEAELARYRGHLEELVAARTHELALAKGAAEAANVAKSTFLANMSHEIRTPLNAILGLAHLVRRAGLPADQQDRLRKIDLAGEHLLSTINAILELSKIEAGHLTLAAVTCDVPALVHEVVGLLSTDAQAKGLQLHSHLAALPADLVGDPTRLRQVLLNLVGNAVKFTDRGAVAVRVQVASLTPDQALLRFEVQDSGPGVPAEATERIFRPFEQVDGSATRRHGGTGLGLALAQRLAERMGGQAGMHNAPGGGSCFWFSARLERSGVQALSRPAPASGADLAEALLRRHHAGARVLVVEDEPINREVTAMLLQDAALAVDLAVDGLEALAMLARAPYDLVLMDVQMPRLDGLTAVRQLRRLPHGQGLPVVALTANAFEEDQQRCRQAGMDDFVAKPVDPERLFAVVLQWLGQRRQLPAVNQAPSLAGAAGAALTGRGPPPALGDVAAGLSAGSAPVDHQ